MAHEHNILCRCVLVRGILFYFIIFMRVVLFIDRYLYLRLKFGWQMRDIGKVIGKQTFIWKHLCRYMFLINYEYIKLVKYIKLS